MTAPRSNTCSMQQYETVLFGVLTTRPRGRAGGALTIRPVLQGYFDEDSMDEFIASETEESSMSMTSEDEKKK